MKKLILMLSLILSLSTEAGISILSDLDETIKISQSSGDISDYVGDSVYTGIPEFFKAAKDYSTELHILSASPSFMRSRLTSVLRKRGIGYKSLTLRSNLREEIFDFKLKAIKKIIGQSTDDFILIGDDYGEDPEVYAEISKIFPGRVLAIYIHVVKGRNLTQEVIPYWTTFDIFLSEFLERRMLPGWVEFVWYKLMRESDFDLIFPKRSQCPTDSNVWEWQLATVYGPEAFELMNHMIKLCTLRSTANQTQLVQSDNIIP